MMRPYVLAGVEARMGSLSVEELYAVTLHMVQVRLSGFVVHNPGCVLRTNDWEILNLKHFNVLSD